MKLVLVRKYYVLALVLLAGCYSVGTSHQTEFGGVRMGGSRDVASMSRWELHAAIERAYLEGELTVEEARAAHTQLDVKGHLTAEQVAVIDRDRLAKRDAYETSKEQLDVVRDVFSTGSSTLGEINNIKDAINGIFN